MHHHLRFNVATQYNLKFFLKNWKGRGLMAALEIYCPETIVTSTTKLILLPTDKCEVIIISDSNKDTKLLRDQKFNGTPYYPRLG